MIAPRHIRVLCVDDHRILLRGLALLIGHEPDMEVVATADSGELAVLRCREHRPDIVLMDLQLPGMSGLEAIRAIRSEAPATKIIVVTMHQGTDDIYHAMAAGAASYILKDALSDDLIRLVREVHAGRHTLPDDVTARLEARQRMPLLTQREIDVVRLIAKGMRNKEIAVALGIAEDTAKSHVRHVMAKLDVHDRSAVIGAAVHRGILHMQDV